MYVHGYVGIQDLRCLLLIIIHGPTDLNNAKPLVYAGL